MCAVCCEYDNDLVHKYSNGRNIIQMDSTCIVVIMFCRDPNTMDTLKTFEDCMNWACSGGFNDNDIFEAKLGIFAQVVIVKMSFLYPNVCIHIRRQSYLSFECVGK